MPGLRNTTDRYGLIARLFHGAMVLAIGANLALGLLFDDAVETGEGRFAALHATLGILTLALLVGRVMWRFVDPPPPITGGVPLERTIAHAGHLGLYALTLVVTLSGWYAASHEGARIDLLGGAALPSLVSVPTAPTEPAAAPATVVHEMLGEHHEAGDEDEAGELWEEVHEWGSWALLVLVLLHTAAAVVHKQRKDGTWERMFG